MSAKVVGDPWKEGFEEGRRAMAKTVASRLAASMQEDEISAIVGFDVRQLFGESSAAEDEGAAEGRVQARSRYDRPAVPGLKLVEPAFVRTVRAARRLTQPQLASILGVNARTVSEWETSPVPLRMKSSSYARLSQLASAGARGAESAGK